MQKKLDGLALALEQAGAYIAERRITFAKYLERWENQRTKVLEWYNKRTMQYPASVAITWHTSFDQLSDDARELLETLSHFAPDPIPRGLIEKEDESGNREDALIELEKFSLVRFLEEPTETLSLHRLVQSVVREGLSFEKTERQLKANNEKHWNSALDLIISWAPESYQSTSSWKKWLILAPHLQTFFDTVAEDLDTESILEFINLYAGFNLFIGGDLNIAEKLLTRALNGRRRLHGENDSWTQTSINNLAALYRAKGNYLAAEELLELALANRINTLGHLHHDTLTTAINFLGLKLETDKTSGAMNLYRENLQNCIDVFGSQHSQTITSMTNLAGALLADGNLNKAEHFYRRALEASEKVDGPEHLDTLSSLNDLANLLGSKGSFDEAEQLFRRALNACEKLLKPTHPDTIRSITNLALLLKQRGHLDEAEPLYRRSLNDAEKSLGKEHPTTLMILNNLAVLRGLKGDIEEASIFYHRALNGCIKVFGLKHRETVNCINNLLGLFFKSDSYREAEILITDLMSKFTQQFGGDDKFIEAMQENLEICRAAMEGES